MNEHIKAIWELLPKDDGVEYELNEDLCKGNGAIRVRHERLTIDLRNEYHLFARSFLEDSLDLEGASREDTQRRFKLRYDMQKNTAAKAAKKIHAKAKKYIADAKELAERRVQRQKARNDLGKLQRESVALFWEAFSLAEVEEINARRFHIQVDGDNLRFTVTEQPDQMISMIKLLIEGKE